MQTFSWKNFEFRKEVKNPHKSDGVKGGVKLGPHHPPSRPPLLSLGYKDTLSKMKKTSHKLLQLLS